LPDIRDDPRAPDDGTEPAGVAGILSIRPLAHADTSEVRQLWGGYVSEGFADNFAGPGTNCDDGLDLYLSLDRWGPGVSMPMLPGALRPHMPKEPSFAVAEQVAAMVDHPSYRCLVAELAGVVVGFVTYSIRPLPTGDEHVAAIEDLFVDPLARRAGIGTALIRSALGVLRRERIGVVHALVPSNPRYAGARKLFADLGWEQDVVAFGHYG
jgi:GNAT superfamily N-acetyltransferase